MEMLNRAQKYRIYPTKEQEISLAKTFGCARKMWNLMLEDSKQYYEETKKFAISLPTKFKNQDEYSYLNEVDSQIYGWEKLYLNHAFKAFFKSLKDDSKKEKVGFPKFKGKHNGKQSYTTTRVRLVYKNEQGKWESDENKNTHVKLPIIGCVKCVIHRPLPTGAIIKHATIIKVPSGKYYISLSYEYEEEKIELNLDINKFIGLDYSSPKLFVDNQGNTGDYPKYFKKSAERLSKLDRALSRKQRCSKNYYKQLIKNNKLKEKVHNQRLDWQHKKTHEIATNPEIHAVCIEDLSMKEIGSKSSEFNLGKTTWDNAWFTTPAKESPLL